MDSTRFARRCLVNHSVTRWWVVLSLASLGLVFGGCGSEPSAQVGEPQPQHQRERHQPAAGSPITTTNAFADSSPGSAATHNQTTTNPPIKETQAAADPPAAQLKPETFRIAKMAVDEDRAAANGIRKISGRHLALYTDLPSQPAIDELPSVFDQAVPQWCEYFGIDLGEVADWQMQGFLMQDAERFRAARLLPAGLPQFLNGYNQGFELWVLEQKSPYYRRHLLLHEGTHGFMDTMLGGLGPPWYSEGMAELLGTHRWQDEKLTLRYNPRSKEETPDWGRVKLVRDRLKQREAMGKGPYSLQEVMELGPTAHRQVEPYGWCWAAASFFDNHPDYQGIFRALKSRVKDDTYQFNKKFRAAIRETHWREAQEQWRLYMDEIDYGYDVTRAAVQYKPGEPLSVGGQAITIEADRGWQSSGVYLEEGAKYQIKASGRYQVGDQPQIWWCEPGGVTIHYYRGQPLGTLMAAIRDDANPIADKPYLAIAAPIGTGREITPEWSGTLYFKINEAPRDLADNAGELTIKIDRK